MTLLPQWTPPWQGEKKDLSKEIQSIMERNAMQTEMDKMHKDRTWLLREEVMKANYGLSAASGLNKSNGENF